MTVICGCRYDHLVAIERSGRAEDGNYYNMRAVNIKHLVDPIDDLFIAAKNIPGITTIGSQHFWLPFVANRRDRKVKSHAAARRLTFASVNCPPLINLNGRQACHPVCSADLIPCRNR